MSRKVRKKRLNKKRTLVFIIVIYILCSIIYCLFTRPIKHIEINGTTNLTDAEILRVSKLKDYPSILKYTSHTLEKRIKTLDLVDKVDVKKCLGLKIIINIKENKMLFYMDDTKKIALGNGNIINNDYKDVLGIPIFTNKIKSNIFNKFVNEFSKINDDIIYEIETIEYYPQITDDGKVITNDRFKLLMKDGNTIITNLNGVSVINKYNDIYASLGDKSGTINLDTNELSNLVFIPYDEVLQEPVETDAEIEESE